MEAGWGYAGEMLYVQLLCPLQVFPEGGADVTIQLFLFEVLLQLSLITPKLQLLPYHPLSTAFSSLFS